VAAEVEIVVVYTADGAKQRPADGRIIDPQSLVAKLHFGAEHAEVIAPDQIGIDADLVIDVEPAVEFRAIEIDVEKAFVTHHDPGFHPNVGRVVAGQCRRRDRADGNRGEEVFTHRRTPVVVRS
jgi:hypothetical protein